MESKYLVVSTLGDIYNVHTELHKNTHLMRAMKELDGHRCIQKQQIISCI
jgi:hypothetical protein